MLILKFKNGYVSIGAFKIQQRDKLAKYVLCLKKYWATDGSSVSADNKNVSLPDNKDVSMLIRSMDLLISFRVSSSL